MIANEQVLDALRQVMHPEMKRNLVELGMIKDVVVGDGNVTFTLALPFKEVPIKDDLVRSVREAVATLDSGLEIEVKLAEMSQQERAAFTTAAEGGPKPAQSVNKVDQAVAVLSGKGGVGKSSVTALLAVALRRREKQVGVLDADITGPSIPKMFDLHQPPPMGPMGIFPAETRTGIKVMSINLLLPNEDQAVIWRGPLISGAIKQFWAEVVWGNLDYLIVDLPPGTSDASLTVMQSIPLNGIVLVTSPQDLAGMVVRKAAHMAEHLNVPIVGLVENMAYLDCSHCGQRIHLFGPSAAEATAARLDVLFLGRLPLDPDLAVWCDNGRIEEYEGTAFTPIAEAIVEQVPARKTVPPMP